MLENTHLKVKAIKAGSIIKIEVGHGFYARFQELLFKFINDNPNEDFVKAMENLKNNPANSPYEYHLETLMSLLFEMENKAEEQGLIVMKDIEQPTN